MVNVCERGFGYQYFSWLRMAEAYRFIDRKVVVWGRQMFGTLDV